MSLDSRYDEETQVTVWRYNSTTKKKLLGRSSAALHDKVMKFNSLTATSKPVNEEILLNCVALFKNQC